MEPAASGVLLGNRRAHESFVFARQTIEGDEVGGRWCIGAWSGVQAATAEKRSACMAARRSCGLCDEKTERGLSLCVEVPAPPAAAIRRDRIHANF